MDNEEIKNEKVEENEVTVDETANQNVEEEKKDHPNLRTLRQKAEELEKENRRYRERVSRLEQYVDQFNNTAQQKRDNNYNQPDPYEDDIVERKDFNELKQKVDSFEEYKRKRDLEEYSNRVHRDMRKKHTDYDTVVNEDNINQLWADNPKKARLLKKILLSGDLEMAAEETYEACKRYAPDKNHEENRRKLEENAKKPQNPSIISQVSSINNSYLTDDEKKRLRRETERIIQGY